MIETRAENCVAMGPLPERRKETRKAPSSWKDGIKVAIDDKRP